MEANTSFEIKNPPQGTKEIVEDISEIVTRVQLKYPGTIINSISLNFELGKKSIVEKNEVRG